jgi:hypothetical protein
MEGGKTYANVVGYYTFHSRIRDKLKWLVKYLLLAGDGSSS